MKRRTFLAGILAASAAPAIVRASSLMPVVTRPFGGLPLIGVDHGGPDKLEFAVYEFNKMPYSDPRAARLWSRQVMAEFWEQRLDHIAFGILSGCQWAPEQPTRMR